MTKLPTLYELEQDWDSLMELAESEPDMNLADTIEGMAGTLEEKRKAVGYYMENIRATVEARKAAAKRMTESAKTLETRHARLTDYLIQSMRKHGIDEIACPEWTLKLQQNPERVELDDDGIVPFHDGEGNELYRTIPERFEHDKKAIKAAIQRGEDIPGAHLERGWRLKLT